VERFSHEGSSNPLASIIVAKQRKLKEESERRKQIQRSKSQPKCLQLYRNNAQKVMIESEKQHKRVLTNQERAFFDTFTGNDADLKESRV